MTQTFDERMQEFIQRLAFMYQNEYNGTTATFLLMPGRKFTKVAINKYNSTSVYCFVDNATGDILKADGWLKPAKDARGSIWNPDCDVGPNLPCNVHGGNLYKKK